MFKNTIGDLQTPTLIGVLPDTPVKEAISIMRSRRISCLPVLDDQVPIGIFTERSLTSYVVEHGFDFGDKTIRELMSAPVFTVTAQTPLYESYGILISNRIRHLVVVDDRQKAIGVVTFSNIINYLGSEYFLDVKLVSHIMSKKIATVSRETPVMEALSCMAVRSISCLIVTQGSLPVGMVTERDVSRLITEAQDIRKLQVQDLMSSPVLTVALDTPVFQAAQIMRNKSVRRLVAVNEDGEVVGLTTQSDIIKGLEGKYIDSLRQIVREKDSALQDTMRDLTRKTIYLDNILRSAIDFGIVATDPRFHIVYYNPTAEEILGKPSEQMIGRDVRQTRFEQGLDLAQFNRAVELIRNRSHHTFHFESNSRGRKRNIQARITGIRDDAQELVGYLLMLTDITERKKAEQTIQYMAYHDNLTGLPNRLLFNDRLQQEMARCRRNNDILAIMVLDLDQFKAINDTLGHHAGDVLLKSISLRLQNTIRECDTVARMGGDEFLIVLSKLASRSRAMDVGKRILQAVSAPLDIEDTQVAINVSIGIAFFPVDGDDADTLIKTADKAMYRAKEQNRRNNGSNIHTSEMN